MKEIYTLDMLLQEYPIALIDTSALSGCFFDDHTSDSDKKLYRSVDNHEFIMELMQRLEGESNIFISPQCLREFSFGEIYEDQKILLNLFKGKRRVLRLQGGEKAMYAKLCKKYSWFMGKEMVRRFGLRRSLSRADFSFLLAGTITSQVRNPTSLISNDYGIVHGWDYILKKELLDPKTFGFFVRHEGLRFLRLEGPKNLPNYVPSYTSQSSHDSSHIQN